MLNVNKLIEERVITESMCRLVFTDDPHMQTSILANRSLVRSSYRICLFYTALIQAYFIAKAIHCNLKVKELGLPEKLTNAIVRRWNLDESYDMGKDSKSVFSFLISCCDCGQDNIISPKAKAVIVSLREMYERYSKVHTKARAELTDNDFLTLLKMFPLLATTEVDYEKQMFSFPISFQDRQEGFYQIRCIPFVYYIDVDTNAIVRQKNNNAYVLAAVKRGEKNGEIRFITTPIHKSDTVGQIYSSVKPIREQAAKDESLYLICDAMDINTDWRETDDCWCDLAFLRDLNAVTISALVTFWKSSDKKSHHTPDKNFAMKLKDMFYGSEIYERISENSFIGYENIDNIFYELYINCGVFVTMYSLFLDSPEHEYSKKLFNIYLDAFVAKGRITKEEREQIYNNCVENVAVRVKKLSAIVSPHSAQYDRRKRSIKAEWRAYWTLKAAGINAENLFTDEELILSIDDYYSMIKNPSTTLKSDLNSVLSQLIEFYGALISIDARTEFDVQEYMNHVSRIRAENSTLDTRQLFRCFIDIVKRSEGNAAIKKHLGRESVCSIDGLEYYAESIPEQIDDIEESVPSKFFSKKYIFISYAHKDIKRVKPIVEHWKANGFSVFFDEEKFSGGDDWKDRADEAIESQDCVAVISFISKNAAVSEAVAYELEHAEITESSRSKDMSHNRFVIPVNLEGMLHGDYLREILHSSSGKTKDYVSIIDRVLSSSKIAFNLQEDTESKIDKEIRSRIFPNGEEEYIEMSDYTSLELDIANFYCVLKYGEIGYHKTALDVDRYFREDINIARCIFPLVVSVKETKIKRDNIALVGYEIIRGKGEGQRITNYILSANRLEPDDYYCVPNYETIGEDCSWMVNPFLVKCTTFNGIDELESNE